MTHTIRALNQDDWQSFSAIRLEALKNNHGVFGSNYAKEANYLQQDWQSWFPESGGCVFGLFNRKDIIGTISVYTYNDDPSGKTAIVCAVYVRPDHQGKGYSRLLYKACVEFAVQYQPWKKLIVSHRVDNLGSRGAIIRQGFVYTHNVPKTWPDGVTCDEVCYELELDQLRNKQ